VSGAARFLLTGLTVGIHICPAPFEPGARTVLPKANDPEAILSARISIARALATQPPHSTAAFRSIAEDARKHSFPMQELSARLALLEAERSRVGKLNGTSVTDFVADARFRGYLLFARKALALTAVP